MEVLPVRHISSYGVENEFEYAPYPSYPDDDGTDAIREAVAKRLEEALRGAKRTHLSSCGEVLLPLGLLQEIAKEIVELADSEPCGLRGCTLHLNFQGEEDCRKLCTVKCDPYTASTFELYLTFKQSTAVWNSFLPQFLKKITRSGTVMISPEYELSKKKLYRSYSV